MPVLRAGDSLVSIDLSRPLVARGLVDPMQSGLSIAALLRQPMANVSVEYFSDARQVGTVPDKVAQVGEIARNITKGGPQKFGTTALLEQFPGLLETMVPPRVREVWGDRFGADQLGLFLTVPVFLSVSLRTHCLWRGRWRCSRVHFG